MYTYFQHIYVEFSAHLLFILCDFTRIRITYNNLKIQAITVAKILYRKLTWA
ncbi:hypothetical protein HanRHA438_Chr17g0825911 [Helianthus annuus]|nr:hypothetical protein HanRHA438_Chr17g0825911 [Helianthus annuus]